MLHKVKLKHLDIVSKEEFDIAGVMIHILGYKNSNVFTRYFNFLKVSKKATNLLNECRNVDVKKLELPNVCEIKVPKNIEDISFLAMLETRMNLNAFSNKEISDAICDVVSCVCFNENYKTKDFDSNSFAFKGFRYKVMNMHFCDAIGIYNWIVKELEKSDEVWEKLFFSVNTEDEDYTQASGGRMKQFNVIETIKNLCNDFNLSYKQAWQMPYKVTQMNSYSSATKAFVHKNMVEIKERKMKQKRGRG